MQNKFSKKGAIFTIITLLILVAFVPAINSSTVKNNTLYDDIITYDIYFGTTSPPPKVVSNQTETTYDPAGLEYNTTYYWQIIAWDEQGNWAEGPIWSFTTETIGPSVETLYADQIGKNNATLYGKILGDGGEQCRIRFRYRESGETNWTYPSDWHGSYVTNEAFSEYIDGLNLSTLYEFQAGAKNSIDEEWGELKNFTTAANQPPVAIIVAPSNADKKTDITFDGSNSYDPDGYIVEYNWDFGDGGTGNESIITHQFQHSGLYTVTLQVEDNDGGVAYTTHSITIINHAPVASFVADQYYIAPGDTVTFDGTASYDPDGDSLTYEWKLGDGTVIGTDAIITYTFTVSGTFTVILTVCDDDPANPLCATVTCEIYVNSPPVADAGPDRTVFVFEVVTFDGSNSYDPDGYIVNYSWDFGDGESGNGMIVQHVYYYNGEFIVTLTVTDDFGSTDNDTCVIEVINAKGVDTINRHVGTTITTDVSLIKTSSLNYPPKTPSDPYPEDGATNVPVDVVLSWTGGEDTPPDTPIIDGPTRGRPGITYYYNFTIDDDDGDLLMLLIDWDDGTQQVWIGPYEPGQNITVGHSWEEKGTYVIKAKTRDIFGVQSGWGSLEVEIPRAKFAINNLLLCLLEHFPNAFIILKYFLGLRILSL